ncbi:voltage-dependent calcium channel beta subunit-associated regulatory protein isoform X3 [Protopterus annectens]|uniref:voltage-dependent calcium channel beta subunit-associated regulatory protein isoform X3 n=1 Tax=Protopterus annectens TaxID=7888 RepID=UPI001CFBE047|nr:voltage-dependent calcium channel beta subunit-associated regulatory protein isoform X3 [Protopterus annectens]
MNDQPAWKTLGANTTAPPEDSSVQDGYVLLLVLVSIFIGGTLVLLSGILIICRKCCETDRRYLRASEDAEKTNTTYLDDSQPTQEITIKVDDSDCLSSSSYHDVETERFLSTCSTGRRVSFNEASLFDHEKKAQEKGRRYTLTEGDFHHLKNARLTHLAIPPPALKIVTIHECESTENTSIPMTMCRPSSSRSNLSIFQQALGSLPQTALASHSTSPSLALPGDTFNSTVDTSFIEVSPPMSSDSGESVSAEAVTGTSKGNSGGSSGTAEAAVSSSQGTVLQFFTKLRRHTSLEGASPYFKIKKWKFESSQRASSLDTRDAAEIAASSSEVAEGMDSIEQQTAYRDIWNLRASLELYASLDQSSSNDKDSVRSDADSVCSFGGLPSFPSQDAADELESFEEKSMPSQKTKQDSVESERGSDGESGTRKLLQMDSGYASIEAPTRPLEDIRMFGTGEKDKTASEKRRFFTTSGHKATVFESFESQLFNEELEEEGAVGGEVEPSMGWSPYGQMFITRDYLHRRDYSIDEKTDALFNEFLRHDPQFDDSPLKTKHRSRIHLRKQWQRTKQYSDPGVRYPSAFERHRTPLRRGDSVSDPLDNRYHSTLPRIISTADEEYSEGCSGTDHTRSGTPDSTELNLCEGKSADPEIRDKVQNIDEETSEQSAVLEQLDHTETSDSKHTLGHISQFTGADDHLTLGYGPQTIGAELLDKISTNIEDRLYTNFKRSKDSPEFLVAVAHTSPDHSPV